ncbi:MAG: TIGR00159 family protein [Candidatus Omnitrophica bacterium]|nr:TIGR00159 family protein [Candidatus Omnitrophota bacterium]
MPFVLHWAQELWRPVFEIVLFWFIFYFLLVYIKDSGMAQALKGLVVLVVFFLAAQVFELKTIRWILAHLFEISILGCLILFQPELRRGLTRIGQNPLFKIFLKEERAVEELVKAVTALAERKIGALIAIEREVSLKPYAETGIALDGILTSELLLTIFMPNTPVHDGGVVVQGGRVVAVGCLFPLSQSQSLSKVFGTRHRAGLGLSEETDALVIVASEETGGVSLMNHGKMMREVNEEKLRQNILELYKPQGASSAKSFGRRRFWRRGS